MIGLSYVKTVKIKQYFGFGMGGENVKAASNQAIIIMNNNNIINIGFII